MGRLYTSLLQEIPNIQLPISQTPFAENIYWVYPILLLGNSRLNAQKVTALLNEFGVGTRPFFWPIHKQPVFNKAGLFLNDSFKNAENIAQNGFYIPSGMAITIEQIYFVVEKLKAILN